jgi:hypothetical protein
MAQCFDQSTSCNNSSFLRRLSFRCPPSCHVPAQHCAWPRVAVRNVQAVRNLDDLETMACPQKYKDMRTFYKYYSGEKRPPFPTLFSEQVPAVC